MMGASTALVLYDKHDLLLLEVEDALGNKNTAGTRSKGNSIAIDPDRASSGPSHFGLASCYSSTSMHPCWHAFVSVIAPFLYYGDRLRSSPSSRLSAAFRCPPVHCE